MSKYQQRGAYHYAEFKTPGTPYRAHVLDVVRHIEKHVPYPGNIVDIGCGEGLVLRKLTEMGHRAVGCEVDQHAVKLAHEKGNDVREGMVDVFDGQTFDAALMLDVLEHVKDEDLEWTLLSIQDLAPLVFMAVPDRTDPHGFRTFTLEEIKHVFDPVEEDDFEWECLHAETRHARHFVVLSRKAEEVTVPEDEDGEAFGSPDW